MKAGSPRLIQSDSLSSDSAFKSCMLDENCVVHTIKKYTDDRMTVILKYTYFVFFLICLS